MHILLISLLLAHSPGPGKYSGYSECFVSDVSNWPLCIKEMNLFFLLILYPTILLKYQGSVWVLREADATMHLHMQEIYWEVPGRGNGKEQAWARGAFRSCCRCDSSGPHLASVFLCQRSTEFYVPVFYL